MTTSDRAGNYFVILDLYIRENIQTLNPIISLMNHLTFLQSIDRWKLQPKGWLLFAVQSCTGGLCFGLFCLITANSQGQTPVELWREAHFAATELSTPGITGLSADPDGDGLSNLLEYALGSDPKSANLSAAPTISFDPSGSLIFCFRRASAATDLAFFAESSPDLQTWNAADPELAVISVVDDGAGNDLVTVKANGAGTRFLRLEVVVRGTLGSDGTADDWKLAAFGNAQVDGTALNAAGVPLYQAVDPRDPNSPAMRVTINNPVSGAVIP